ncbi:related to TAP42, component of the Tor signaling pathway [Rhynchosporium agropyri]|uniref:Related to TAP42, component of the Tor signaling pathway n=1 Tax=Rhynchosporium agropyri TaxID=914238 RepID=A0A1E1KE39_9HELO|nr:related to TAP42, component of the Tor signaling pathway [Rhynchosporium agropyri]
MAEQSIKSFYASAEKQRKDLEASWYSNTAAYQQNLAAAISTYDDCLKLADRLSLFSPNETLEDLTSGDLQYLLINYRLAELILRISSKDRKITLLKARAAFEKYLSLLDHYEILDTAQKKLYRDYCEYPTTFSTINNADPNLRRGAKIANFKLETELKSKLEFLAKNPAYLQNDDDAIRELQLTNITLCTHHTFQALESLNLESQILAMAPPSLPDGPESLERDYRERMGLRDKDDVSGDRLDMRDMLSTANKGPILSANGKPLRPFTLLDSRQTVKAGVFRSGHNLPTMTIDEYLEEERRNGGIIEGGGAASGLSPEPDEDNYEKGDEETIKAREWDEFTEANPKGAGNTMNRG